MAALAQEVVIGVVGAGAMGAGVAQVAAQAGHRVVLYDAIEGAAIRAHDALAATLTKLVGRGKLTEDARSGILQRLVPAETMADLAPAGLVIEAIVEDLAIKRGVFATLESLCGPDAILASNTSSLSITAIASALKNPARAAGMHFFNPAPLMALVEVIRGVATSDTTAQTLIDTARAWGKTPVACRNTPGFIVNRVARPYYGEALKLAQEGAASPAVLDAVMREAGGFRMGPFELTDLIGHDVNFAVTRSVHAAYFGDPRYVPSLVQQELVEAGWLGRKSGRGFYDYGPEAAAPFAPAIPPEPAPAAVVVSGALGPAEGLLDRLTAAGVAITRDGDGPEGTVCFDGVTVSLTDGRSATACAAEYGRADWVVFDHVFDWAKASGVAVAVADQCRDPEAALGRAAGLFAAARITARRLSDAPGLAVGRTIAMLANEAAEAVNHQVASAADIDLAMTLGVNYPQGPLAWADRIGPARVLALLDHVAAAYGDDRYRASSLLRRRVLAGGRLHG